MMDLLKKYARPLVAFFAYHFWFRFFRSNYETTREGKPLKPGITAVVAAKNESYTLPFCLNSLIGIADQVVCIDNGSEDDTLEKMNQFKKEHAHTIEVDIISLPGALLGDCREAGLAATKYQWHLRWDADMVFKTSGAEDAKPLREKVLKDDRPRTIQLPRTNLWGDFHHTKNIEPVDAGEPILVRFSKYIRYVEYGKFDAIKVPLFYKMTSEKKLYYFHCEGLKPTSNLVYRKQYFDWREACNKFPAGQIPKTISDFDAFKKDWNLQWLGTNDAQAVKWRFMRERAFYVMKYDEEKFGKYPEILKKEMETGAERFRIIYNDSEPYNRIDEDDKEMKDYPPSQEDLLWEKKLIAKFKS